MRILLFHQFFARTAVNSKNIYRLCATGALQTARYKPSAMGSLQTQCAVKRGFCGTIVRVHRLSIGGVRVLVSYLKFPVVNGHAEEFKILVCLVGVVNGPFSNSFGEVIIATNVSRYQRPIRGL